MNKYNKEESLELRKNNFIQLSKEIHENKYDYSKVIYVKNINKVIIICPIHGEFEQTPNNHTSAKTGCPSCSKNNKRTTKEFIDKANQIHNNRYIYSKSNYINAHTKVIITCTDHGDFKQSPNNHLRGQNCPVCVENLKRSQTEKFIFDYFKKYNPIQSYSPEWLGKKELDIYFPNYNFAIEYNGTAWHHSGYINNSMDKSIKNRYFHKMKYRECLEHGINLIYIWDFEDLDSWLEKITNYLENMNKHDIVFKNTKRFYNNYTVYGESFIYENTIS